MIAGVIGFNPLSQIFFQFESYYKLSKYKRLIREADEVYIGGCIFYGAFRLVKSLKKKILIDTHFISKDLALKMKSKHRIVGSILAQIWHIIENNILNNVDEIITVSENDKNFIARHYKVDPKNIKVIHNEVAAADFEKYQPEAIKLKNDLAIKNKIALFIGNLGAVHNADAEEFIRKKLAPHTPNITYVIVGKNPDKLESKENIIYTGFVDAVDPYIIMADVCLAPLAFGGGTKIKVLDYMKYGKEILATDIALEGISSEDIQPIKLNMFASRLNKI